MFARCYFGFFQFYPYMFPFLVPLSITASVLLYAASVRPFLVIHALTLLKNSFARRSKWLSLVASTITAKSLTYSILVTTPGKGIFGALSQRMFHKSVSELTPVGPQWSSLVPYSLCQEVAFH